MIVYLWSVGIRWSGLAGSPERAQQLAAKLMSGETGATVVMARPVYNQHLERTYEHLGRMWTGTRDEDGTVTWAESVVLSLPAHFEAAFREGLERNGIPITEST
jgi:hypothetical protein